MSGNRVWDVKRSATVEKFNAYLVFFASTIASCFSFAHCRQVSESKKPGSKKNVSIVRYMDSRRRDRQQTNENANKSALRVGKFVGVDVSFSRSRAARAQCPIIKVAEVPQRDVAKCFLEPNF